MLDAVASFTLPRRVHVSADAARATG
jgi:hypothetical protein